MSICGWNISLIRSTMSEILNSRCACNHSKPVAFDLNSAETTQPFRDAESIRQTRETKSHFETTSALPFGRRDSTESVRRTPETKYHFETASATPLGDATALARLIHDIHLTRDPQRRTINRGAQLGVLRQYQKAQPP